MPNGSWIEAISGEIQESFTHIEDSSIIAKSAKQPSKSTPLSLTTLHKWESPVEHCKHDPQVTWLSAEIKSPQLTDLTLEPIIEYLEEKYNAQIKQLPDTQYKAIVKFSQNKCPLN